MRALGIIPARYASSRFPGKPLADILGKPMIWHVYTRSRQALENVIIATDDQRIFDVARQLDMEVVMTGTNHRSGTERCREALDNYEQQTGQHFDLVINIQGDEPLIDPKIIKTLAESFDQDTEIATLIRKENERENLFDPNIVKVVVNAENEAIYFSRTAIPYLRDIDPGQWLEHHTFYSHIGIYAYRSDILRKIVNLKPGILEQAEKLEQLRWLENGYTIKTILVDYLGIGVDVPKDLDKVKSILKSRGNGQF